MLGLGWTEMLVIGVVALIVIGPKDLPVVMGRLGKFMGQIRRMGNEFQREINRTTGLDEVRNLRNSITSPLKKTAEEIRRDFNTMTPTGQKPSGIIKPADPKVESVVDELRAAAGMPAAAKSNDELAADYGFKPGETSTGPVKAAQVSQPQPLSPVPTAPVVTSDLAPIETVVAPKPKTVRAAPAKKPPLKKAVAAKTSEVEVLANTPPAVGAELAPVAVPKTPRKPRVKAAVTVAEAEPIAPVKKPRAPRKKPETPEETK
ncbi:Sec-independent protein translocase protein TatB [Devosia sp. Leaf64]|uniref:Sec-independent protein translocase protein TatB n=1 Tax=Devosia sp. Leaf64 TaxID=1736229 RepID=UPI0009E6C305|nr:Sec-independent protein translocase protein TatB [Devosia sp. Leaf64]